MTPSSIRKARPIIDAGVEKASEEHYTLQEVGKLNILLDAAILLLDDAAEYLDELDQIAEISAEQAAHASILVAEAKSMPMMLPCISQKNTRTWWQPCQPEPT
jgi:hypothetical protein